MFNVAQRDRKKKKKSFYTQYYLIYNPLVTQALLGKLKFMMFWGVGLLYAYS